METRMIVMSRTILTINDVVHFVHDVIVVVVVVVVAVAVGVIVIVVVDDMVVGVVAIFVDVVAIVSVVVSVSYEDSGVVFVVQPMRN